MKYYKTFISAFGDEKQFPNQVGASATDAVQLDNTGLAADGTLPGVPRCVYICVEGDLDWAGHNVNHRRVTPVLAGAILPFVPKYIWPDNTTAVFELWY